MAERVGFEPTVPFGTSVFKTDTFNRSDTSPCSRFDILNSNAEKVK